MVQKEQLLLTRTKAQVKVEIVNTFVQWLYRLFLAILDR